MEYDVTGTLKIDTEAFEKALKEAQGKLDKFKKDFQSLNNLSSKDSFKELSESLGNVEKSVQDLKMDFEKVDKSADNVVQSVKDIKKETDNVTKSVKSLKNETKQIDKSFLRNLTSMKRKMDELSESMALSKSKIKLLNDKSLSDRRSLNYDRDVGWDNEELEKKVAKHNELIRKEIQQYNQLKGELKELNKEYDSLMSSDNSLEGKLTQLKHLVLESEKASKSMKKLTQQAEKEKELWLSPDSDDSRLHSKNYQELKKLSDEQVKLFTEYRSRIKTLLDELVNDFGLSFSEIEEIMGREISTKSIKDMTSRLDEQISIARNNVDSLKNQLSTLQTRYSDIHKFFTDRSIYHLKTARRNKDGSIHQRDQNNFERSMSSRLQTAEKILEKDFPRIANQIKNAETELLKLEQLREKLISSSSYGKDADYVLENLEKDLQKKKESIEFWVNSIRELNEKINSTTNLEEKHSLKNNRNSEINTLKERVNQYKQIKAEIESLSTSKGIDKPKESLDNATKSAEHLKEEMNKVSQSSKKTADTVTTLDDFYNQATASAEKLTAETKKTGAEVDALQRRISRIKLDKSFTKDFYSAVRSAEGGNGVELKPVYNQLKKDYKDLVKNKAEFERLFTNAVRRTNTSLYPSRDPDKHTNVGGRNFGYIDRSALISLGEFNKLMDKADAKVKLLNGEMQKTSPEVGEQTRNWKKVGNELIKAKEEAMRLNDEMRKLSLRSIDGEDIPHSAFEKATAEFEKQKEVVRSLEKEFGELRKAGEVPIKVIEPTKELSDINAELEKLRAKSSELFKVLNGFAPFEGSDADLKRMQKEYDKLETQIGKLISKKVDLEEGLINSNITEPVDKLREVVFKTTESVEQMNAEVKKTVETSEQLDEPFDQATSSVKKLEEYIDQATASAEKLNAETKKTGQFLSPDKSLNDLNSELLDAYGKYYDLKNEAHRIKEEESGSVEELKKATTEVKKQREEVKKLEGEFRKAQDNVRKLTEPLRKRQDHLRDMLEGTDKSTGMRQSLTEARAEYRELLKQKKELQAEIDKIIADNGGVLTPEITEANKKLFEELHHIDSLRQDRLEDTKSYPKEIERVEKKIEQLDKEIQSYYSDAGKYLEGMGEGAKLGEEKISEFDAKLKQQHEGLDKMLNESTTKATEGIKKVETAFTKSTGNIKAQIKQIQQAGQGIYKFFRGNANLNTMGKWMPPQMYSQPTNRWVHEQLSTTRDFFKGFTQGFAKLKKEQSESVTWMNELHTKMEELRYGSRDFINTELFTKAKSEANKYMVSLDKMRNKLGLIEKYQYAPTGNKVGVGFAGSLQFQEAIIGAERYVAELKKVEMQAKKTAEMNARLTQQYKYNATGNVAGVGFAGSSDFQKAIEGAERYVAELKKVEMQAKKTAEAQRMLTQQYQYNKTGNVAGVGFAGSNQFQQMNKGLQEYNRLSNVANLNTQRMGLGFEKFGQYSKQAESNVRSLSGVFRTLRTTLSMIGGMFVWEFAFKIMDATKSTISAKSEMESYYKTLNMGSKEIASFNKSLDNTVNKFQKMNKFQLGETISALGVEFKMSTDEMNQIMKVAPMIVNEYLRAGRSTEEAILAIKDISQGEFLRLSRETGVGKTEIKEAGWSGDNKDILSLYQALEKIGKARHWDVFASKATSLNDVMLITENRMTEFATLLSDAVTPIIVGSFNALGDAFNSASRWYEGMGSYDKAITQMVVLGTAGLSTAGIFNSHLLPAVKNFGTNVISSFLGVDSAIAKEKGLAQAIAHETAVERIANIERKGGQKVLHSKIMTLKAEELANKLGMNTTKLRMRYENLQQMAMKRGTTELKARELAQRSLILAEEQNITTTQAMNILLEEEALAEMGTAKALIVRKLGLDANIVSEEGMVVALNERIAQSFPFISSLVSETLATLGLESATATLIVTLGLMVAPLIAIGVAIAPLIANFLDLQKSYEKLADTFENGQQRIDELEQKQKGYQKTIDELGNKTNLTAQEEAKLQEARDGLTYTTEALEDATNQYNKSVEYTHIVNKNIEKIEGERAKNLKEINKELEKQTGKKYTIDSSYGMTTAYKEQYRTLQVIAWEENHRPERFKKLSESIKNTSKDQEEYNKKIQEFGNDWNQAYSDMEDAQLKRIDPNADTFTRLWSYVDESWAIAKMDWIEFWADPFASISGQLGFDGLSEAFNDALTQMGQDWDNFWQPITDFFNNFSVGADFDPFAGLKDWWSGTNDWLDSIMPDISVDSIKEWVRTHIKEPFQKAVRDFLNNPFGGGDEGDKTQKQGSNAKKSFNWGSMFNFDFSGIKSKFSQGISGVISGASPILRGAGELWSKISNNNGLKVVSSARQGLSGLKQAVTQKFNEGQAVVKRTASSWGKSAYNTGNSIYSNLKTGVGDLGSLIRSKFKGIKEAIDGAKKGISSSVKAIADAITSPLSGLQLPSINFGGGYYGSRRSVGGRIRMPRVNQPVYGSSPSSMGFDTVLATMLTEQGFRSPSSYQFYPNSQKSVQEAWDTGKANCFDGARVILALASMFGLKGHMVTGTWNGTGHSGAVIGGKLYDMTQFQRRGVFRGTAGVHFGSSAQRTYGAGKQENNKIININVTNDLSNARIYGMDDLDSHIKQATEKTFYELNSVDGAIGY